MKICGLILFFILSGATNGFGGIRPSFSIDCAWAATDIVVATEGAEIDGNFTVLESLKGDLDDGETVSIPAFAALKPESARQIKDWDYKEVTPFTYVSGDKVILFLKKNPNSKDLWEPANVFKDFKTSIVWIEEAETFVFLQVMNPGASILVDYGQTETEIRNRIDELTELKNALDSVLKIEDNATRARRLERFARSDFYRAR